jgi:hypothetical protein
MTQNNPNPKSIDQQAIQAFARAVSVGEYRLFSAPTELPAGIPWGGPDCQCVVVAASAYSGPGTSSIPPDTAPSGDVYLWRSFRIGQGGSPPHKADDCLYYTDSDGNSWRVHSKDSPDHHKGIMSGSGMSAISNDFYLPSASSGTLDEYRAKGAHLDFENPFWKTRK